MKASAAQSKANRAIGLVIQIHRERLNISRRDLAIIIGTSPRQVSNYERGREGVPAPRILPLCKTLRISPNFLLGWKEKDGGNEHDEAMLLALELTASLVRLPQRVARTLKEALIAITNSVHAMDIEEAEAQEDERANG